MTVTDPRPSVGLRPPDPTRPASAGEGEAVWPPPGAVRPISPRRAERIGASLPPGPRLPATAQALVWLFRQPELLDACARRFGSVFTLQFAQQGTYVCVGDPGLVREVFTGDPERLRAGANNAVMEPLFGSGSLLLLDGAAHLRERRLVLPPLHGSRIATYTKAIRSAAHREIDSWPVETPLRLH